MYWPLIQRPSSKDKACDDHADIVGSPIRPSAKGLASSGTSSACRSTMLSAKQARVAPRATEVTRA